MKTRTLVSLVFGLVCPGPFQSTNAADTPASANSPGHAAGAVITNSAPASTTLPMELPEVASVVPLPQPPASLPEGVALSGWVGELVKLAEAGLPQEVMLSFVDAAGTFNLEANQIIYLHDIGVASEVITTIIQHDAEIASGLRQVTAGAPPSQFAFRREAAAFNQPSPRVSPRPGPLTPEYDSAPVWPEVEEFVFGAPWFEEWATAQETPELSPVRKPYAVPLTSPILVWPVQGRIPNVTLLRTLP